MSTRKTDDWVDLSPKFFELIGRSMLTWAEIEYQLCTLFCFCVGDKYGSGTAAFYSITMFRTKLNAVNAAAEKALILPQHRGSPGQCMDPLTTWKNINNRLAKKSVIRNKIAHYCGRYRLIEHADKPSEARIELIQPRVGLGADKSSEEIDSDAITLEKLESSLASFEKLRVDLVRLNESLGLKPDLLGLLTRTVQHEELPE